MRIIRRAFLSAALHYVVWVAAVIVIERVFRASPARVAYGVLSAWWATLYVGILANLEWVAIPVLCVAAIAAQYLSISLVSVSHSQDNPIGFVVESLVLSSPIIINGIVGTVRSRVAVVRQRARRG